MIATRGPNGRPSQFGIKVAVSQAGPAMITEPAANFRTEGASRGVPGSRRMARPPRSRHNRAVRWQAATVTASDRASPRTSSTSGPRTRKAVLTSARQTTACRSMDRRGERVSFLA